MESLILLQWIFAKALGYVDAYSMTRRLDDDEVQNHQVSGFGNVE